MRATIFAILGVAFSSFGLGYNVGRSTMKPQPCEDSVIRVWTPQETHDRLDAVEIRLVRGRKAVNGHWAEVFLAVLHQPSQHGEKP